MDDNPRKMSMASMQSTGGWLRLFRSPASEERDPSATIQSPRFNFPELTHELQHYVLSFLAEAPYESSDNEDARSTLTDILPLVSKRFRQLSRSNLLWKTSFCRAIESDNVWKRAAENSTMDISSMIRNDATDFRGLYRRLYDEGIAFTGPVFIMVMDEENLPKRYNLYLFEPRYRLLVERLLSAHDEWKRKADAGEDAGPSPPLYFLHAHRGLGFHRVSGAEQHCDVLLVQIVRCMGMPTGHYDVTLQVDALVRLERFWIEPNTGHLYHAYGRRIKYL